jgi:geranyl-CoA carboxylase alpha subunit
MPALTKILIANRGEITVRIAKTARAMGYATVAVFSSADVNAAHIAACDEAVWIGPAPAVDSYLNSARLIAAAKQSGADAIHPGYGFLSENAAFADACLAAGLTFIGPAAAAIAAMGNKAEAKRRMLAAGVACVPGYQGADQSDGGLTREAARIGYPVMIKAAAGGGGRGMRLVIDEPAVASALTAARSEAERAFGSGELILEKAIVNARHVEVQVFGDHHGHIIHLGERDCSVQRRHQKVIEEAPSPAVDAALRARMGAAAVKAASSIGYVGAGTVEFLLGADGQFYFLEMNTRLQVEHPVTEMITGLDLVEWQLRVACGEPLPLTQADIRFHGHAIECRLYAEDPAQSFLPQAGAVHVWMPPAAPSIRVDHGLKAADTVSSDYDPMIAKIIAFGASREEARVRLRLALQNAVVLGITTNQAFLATMLEHPAFVAGAATTAFIGEHFSAIPEPVPSSRLRAIAAVLLLEASGEMPVSPQAGWASTGAAAYPVLLAVGAAEPTRLTLLPRPSGGFDVHDGPTLTRASLDQPSAAQSRHVTVDGHRQTVHAHVANGTVHLASRGETFAFRDRLREPKRAASGNTAAQLLAPMNGRVVRILAKAGDTVQAGQCVIVLEAMKMQHEIAASRAGTLATVLVSEGQQVATRTLLAELVALSSSA